MKNWSKYSWVLVLVAYLFVNILFNYHFMWTELFFDRSKVGAIEGEIYATEWGLEQIYQKIIHFQNPFSPIKPILYPFGIASAGGDGGFSFYYVFLRPFLSSHQTLMIIMALNLLLANIGMYALLRKMNFSKLISFFIGLCYGFMTFLTPRLGAHPGYSAIGLFPLFYLCLLTFFKAKNRPERIISCLGVAFFFVMMFWQNVYYFIILLISIGCFTFYFLWQKKKLAITLIKRNFFYILLTTIIIFLLLLPCLIEIYKMILFSETPRSVGWGGAIELSADFFSFFIPSIYNRYYGSLILQISHDWTFGGAFEHFIYPGVIILIVYFCLIIFYKKVPKKLKKDITPYLLTSLVFLIFTFGPFLHILGNWWLGIDEGIRLVFPLPFIFLHYIPFLGNIRAPGRLIVGFIFFAYIVCAYLITYFLRNKSQFFKSMFFVLFLIIFIIDHRYDDRLAVSMPSFYPNKLFQIIKKDPAQVSVLEIPFTVRDGFTYFGNSNAIFSFVGNFVHKKSILAGYSGRIPDYIKKYYQNNAFFGYLGRKIDSSIKTNPIIDQSDLINWQTPKIQMSLDAIDFVDLKYVIVNEDGYNHKEATSFLKELGFYKQQTEKNRSLYVRQLESKEFLKTDLTSSESAIYLGMGWEQTEKNFRWSNRRSSVMFKLQKERKMILNFEAEAFYKAQSVTIYLNQKKVARVTISPQMSVYKIPINNKFEKGINTVYFIFDKGHRPNDIDPINPDKRKLSAKFFNIWLTESK